MKMRERGPVIRVRLPLFGSVRMATTYEAVNDLLRDHQRFAQDPTAAGHRWMGAIVRWLPWALLPLATNMLLRDPPDPRRLRGLVEQAFARHSVEGSRSRSSGRPTHDRLPREHCLSHCPGHPSAGAAWWSCSSCGWSCSDRRGVRRGG
jgi:hypothetical protein